MDKILCYFLLLHFSVFLGFRWLFLRYCLSLVLIIKGAIEGRNMSLLKFYSCTFKEHITSVLRYLHWLPIHKRMFQNTLMTFKALNGQSPVFSELIWRYQPTRTLRSSSCSYFSVTNCSTNANHVGIDLLLLPLPSYGTR